MSYLATMRARLESRKTTIIARLELLNTNYDELATKALNEYELESFGGERQKGVRVKLTMLQKQIEYWTKELDRIDAQLHNTGILRFTAKRYIG